MLDDNSNKLIKEKPNVKVQQSVYIKFKIKEIYKRHIIVHKKTNRLKYIYCMHNTTQQNKKDQT